VEILVFELQGQRFGLPGASVRELVRAVAITPLPRQPDGVEGIINLRGQVVPVCDLRQWLGLPAKAVEPTDHLLIAYQGERLVALRVDRAVELARVPAGAVTLAGGLTVKDAEARVAKMADGLVLIPDLVRLLAGPASTRVQEAMAAAPPVSLEENRQS
jgi:purine-binding chemotaxis protein CheW